MSKIQFVRGLWGDDKKTLEYVKGSDEIYAKISPKIYVYGDENYKFLKSLGKDCELISNSPTVHKDNARHKLEIIEKALQDSPEIIFVDWHIMLTDNDLPFNFESIRKEGAPVRAVLRMYKKRYATWRKEEQRKVPASDFLYVKGQRVAKELIETYEAMENPFNLDQVLMKYIDHLTGRWRGADYYSQFFEIPCFSLSWEKELYGASKKEVSFISLKDVKEEKGRERRLKGDKKGKRNKEVTQKLVDIPVATQEKPPIAPLKPSIAPLKPVITQEQPSIAPEKKIYRTYPVDSECWTSTILKRV